MDYLTNNLNSIEVIFGYSSRISKPILTCTLNIIYLRKNVQEFFPVKYFWTYVKSKSLRYSHILWTESKNKDQKKNIL